ncbi:MAG: hypothetical protein SGI98_03005 [Verrucomicrobiota bacterium]|nr:hypothetical protein [Verrucomicrobiota bacterium]
MNQFKAKFEKQITIALFVFVTLLPFVATLGLIAAIILINHNFLNWME